MLSEDLSDVLSEFARTMLTDFPIQGILDHLVKRIVEILPITAAGVTLISADLEPRYVAASDESALRYEKLQTELGEGPCLAAYRSGEAISVPDLCREHRFPEFTPRALESGLTAVFTFPLRHDDAQLGALDLYRTSAGALSPDALRAAQTLADVAAAYLINAQARSDLQDASDQSREAAMHDPLTGLPNRLLMLQLVDRAARASRRADTTAAVMFIDLDRFKEVNDTYGHGVGDELLVAVAERLTDLLRPGDSLARMSGDEFVALCEDLTDSSAIDEIAVRFDAALSAPFALTGVEVHMTASIGVAITGPTRQTPDELVHDADLAMYRQKRERGNGRDGLDLRTLRLARRQGGLAHCLPGALERGELHVEYQPIVHAVDGQLTGVEALLRWTHPARGPVSPTVFIPFAEQSGQIVELGQWVLERSFTDRDLWQTYSAVDIGMAVNVSAHQLMAAGFAETVAGVLDRTSTDPSLLTLEVTESVFVRDQQRAVVVLNEIKDIGVKLALDDFGTGYSSLGYLNTLPIEAVKIDRTFLAKVTNDPDSHRIVSAIIQLAHSLEMTVVAEGVETARQHHELNRLGSDYCQGFYFARPMLSTTLNTLIQQQAQSTGSQLPALAASTTSPSTADRVLRLAGGQTPDRPPARR